MKLKHKKIMKRISALFLAFMITISLFFGSVQNVQAAAVIAPSVGISIGQAFAGLLAYLGVGIAYDNRPQLEEAALGEFDQFKAWAIVQGAITGYKIDKFMEDCKDGSVNLQGEFADVWKSLKEWVVETYYEIGFDYIVEDNRPQLSWLSGSMMSIYTDSSKYPYYIVNTGYKASSLAQKVYWAYVFDTVPLLYFTENNTLSLLKADTNDGFLLNGFWFNKKGSYDPTQTEIVSLTEYNLISTTGDAHSQLDYIVSNLPIFESKEAALSWWTDNVTDGILKPSIDSPIYDIKDHPCDVVIGNTGTLDNYDVIGGSSYIDANGNVITGDITIPGWGDLIGIGNGTIPWPDVIDRTNDIPIDWPEDLPIEDATDIPVDEEDEDERVEDLLPTQPLTLDIFLADLKHLFPFCIPFDLIDCVKLFNANAQAPRFEFPIVVEGIIDYTFVIDLEPFEPIAAIFRVFMVLLFLIGLATATRALIRA